MGLESVTKISDLNPLWPLGSDQKLAGDDHIRNIKLALQTAALMKSIQAFTSSGTWTRPAGVVKVLIVCVGGGAGGGGGRTDGHSGGGGSSGATAVKLLDVTAITSATVMIGDGGAGGTFNGGFGQNGSPTTFVTGPITQCSAAGGVAGTQSYFGGLPAPIGSSIGDARFPGSSGHPGFHNGPGLESVPGNGGGAGAGMYQTPAVANSGGGGSGGYAIQSGGGVGTAGGSGYCVVLEFGV